MAKKSIEQLEADLSEAEQNAESALSEFKAAEKKLAASRKAVGKADADLLRAKLEAELKDNKA